MRSSNPQLASDEYEDDGWSPIAAVVDDKENASRQSSYFADPRPFTRDLEGNGGASSEDLQFLDAETAPNTQVVIRIRPPLPRELQGFRPYQCTTHVDESKRLITISENLPAILNSSNAADGLIYATHRVTFDYVYDQDSQQEEVYERSARRVVLSTLEGYNAAIIAYGQTGTGKTYSMEGALHGEHRGIIPRTVEDIFAAIGNDPQPSSKYLVRASYLQIYNEVISDLLRPERTNLIIREDRRRGVFVDGLSEWVVRSPAEVYILMERGAESRATGATKMNEVSSRSHAVFLFIVEKCTTLLMEEDRPAGYPGDWSHRSSSSTSQSIRVGKLNLVDLAGSERVHITGATGKRLEESKKINASLSALGNVIAALTDRRGREHVPYRDSKLTRILEDSLGGNCKTTMLAAISPSLDAFAESLSTLKFAHRAKSIKNEARVNEDLDQGALLRKYERELRKLKAELQRRNRDLVDKRKLLEAEEQKRRAEADRLAALTALETASREFLAEKEAKRALEAKISAMQGQMLGGGGGKVEDVPAFRALLAREHKRIRSEYEARIKQLEAERGSEADAAAQLEQYKMLCAKQRDIMNALTSRLNERDEQIMWLQEELDGYEQHQRKLEDALDGKTAELIALRKAAVEHIAASPAKGTPLQSALDHWARDPRTDVNNNGRNKPGSPKMMEVSQLLRPTSSGSQHSIPDDGAAARQLHEATAKLATAERHLAHSQTENQRLREALQQQQQATAAARLGSPALAGQMELLREQVATTARQQTVLRMLLDSRFRRVVDDIISAADQIPEEVQRRTRLPRQAAALKEMLNSMVAAVSTSLESTGLAMPSSSQQ